MDYISITNAKEIVDILSNHFKIKSPMVKTHRKMSNRAYAQYGYNGIGRIVISLWSNRKQEDVVLHEFAHILSFNLYGKNSIW